MFLYIVAKFGSHAFTDSSWNQGWMQRGFNFHFITNGFYFLSYLHYMGATLPFSSLTHFSSLGFSTAPPTMSPTPIRLGNSSPASVQVLQVLPPTCEVWASVRPLYFFSHVWDIMRITPAVEGWTAIVYHVQMYKRILGFFIKSS